MGILDAPGLTKNQGDARYPRKNAAVALPATADVFPNPMANPPTITAVSTGTGATGGSTSPITGALNSVNNGFIGSTAATQHVTLRSGGSYTSTTQNSVSYWQSRINSTVTIPENAVEFDWVGTEFAIGFRNVLPGSVYQWVWVDGVPATARPVAYADGTTTQNQHYWLKVVFAAPTVARIKVWLFTCDFGRISYAAGAHMQPIIPTAPKMVTYGDSWIDGAGSVAQWDLHGHLLPRLLGMEGFRVGQGGTGFLTPMTAPKAAYTDSDRLARIAAVNPDYIYIHGGQNDTVLGNPYTAADVTAAVGSVCSQLATLAPNAKLIVHASPIGAAGAPDIAETRNAVIAGAVAASNVIGTIDSVTDTIYGKGGATLQAASGTPWLTGTGNVGSPTTDGTNSSTFLFSDGQHLTTAGHRYWAHRSSLACRKIIAAA